MDKTFIKTKDILIKKNELFFILGPCVIETEEITLHIARTLKEIAERTNLNILFKASFDKANRSSVNSFRGLGMKKRSGNIS